MVLLYYCYAIMDSDSVEAGCMIRLRFCSARFRDAQIALVTVDLGRQSAWPCRCVRGRFLRQVPQQLGW